MKTTEPKPGIKSTEFWLTLLAMVLGAVAELEGDHWAIKIAGLGVMALAALGYSASRGKAKAASALAAPGIGTSSPDPQ